MGASGNGDTIPLTLMTMLSIRPVVRRDQNGSQAICVLNPVTITLRSAWYSICGATRGLGPHSPPRGHDSLGR